MKKIITSVFLILFVGVSFAQNNFETDTIKTSAGNLRITFIAHGTLMFEFNNKVIHADPVSRYADYSKMPKADLIVVTHHHGDHLDKSAIDLIKKDNTDLVLTKLCKDKIEEGTILNNDREKTFQGINVKAVPAYNLVHMRDNGEPFHKKGECNGYVLTFGNKKVYVAGDTENVPEMKNLSGVDIAFVPMNLPYTMTPEMAADAVNMLNPKIFYPYHFGNTNVNELLELLKDKKDMEIRVRKMN